MLKLVGYGIQLESILEVERTHFAQCPKSPSSDRSRFPCANLGKTFELHHFISIDSYVSIEIETMLPRS